MTCSDTLHHEVFRAEESCDDKTPKNNVCKILHKGRISSRQVGESAGVGIARVKPSKGVYVRRVACKARGLSKNHNSETAYFEIPPNAPHGMLLSCSHPECVASGRKFRYCQSKRNFLLRHSHGMFQSSKELKEEVDEICDSLLQDEACDQNIPSPHGQTGKHRRTVSFEGFRRMDGNFLDPIEKNWLELLHKRPDENDEVKMREWTQKVLQISAEKKSVISDRPLKCLKTAKCIPLATVSKANPRPSFSIQSFEITHKKVAQSDTEVIEYSSLFDEIDFDRLFDY